MLYQLSTSHILRIFTFFFSVALMLAFASPAKAATLQELQRQVESLSYQLARIKGGGDKGGGETVVAPSAAYINETSRASLMDGRFGFARTTEGGNAGASFVVTSLADSGPGTLRDALESTTPYWITFAVSGNIELLKPIRTKSDKTIDGRGASIVIKNYGLYIYDAKNIIVTNIAIVDGAADSVDAIGILRSDNVWIDHVTLANFNDGLIDITRATGTLSRVTVSNSRFTNHDKVAIIGLHKPDAPLDEHIQATYAYNHFMGNTVQRHPRVAQAYAHTLNNVIEWDSYGTASFDSGRVYSEGNWYIAARTKVATDFVHGGYSGDYLIPNGFIKSVKDKAENGALIAQNQATLVGKPGYTYKFYTTNVTNKQMITNGAGMVGYTYVAPVI